MTSLGDEGNTIYSPDRLRQMQAAKQHQAKKAKSDNKPAESVLPSPQDKVEIGTGAQQAAPKGEDPVSVSKEEIQRYTEMLKAMPDVRQEEVDRVEAILAEDGYGPEAISVVVDRLMNEG